MTLEAEPPRRRRVPAVTAERWYIALLLASVTQHAALGVLRPMLSYRALELGVDPAYLGFVGAAFALVPLVVVVRLGRSVDRGNEARYAMAGTLAMLSGSLILVWGLALPILIGCSVLLGLGHLGIIVSQQAMVASASTPERYVRRYASLGLAAAFGQLVGPLIGGAVADDGSSAGISAAFAAAAFLSVLSVPLTFAMRGGERRADPSRPELTPRVSLPRILRAPGMAAAMTASLTVGSAVDVLMVYMPAFGQAAGWTPGTVGGLLAARAAAAMVARVILGRLADRLGRSRLLWMSLAISGAGIVGLSLATEVWVAFVVMAIAGVSLGMGQPLTLSAVATLAERGTQATALSVRLMGNRVGQVVVPVTAGLIAGVGGAAAVLALTGAAVGVSAAVVAISHRRAGGVDVAEVA